MTADIYIENNATTFDRKLTFSYDERIYKSIGERRKKMESFFTLLKKKETGNSYTNFSILEQSESFSITEEHEELPENEFDFVVPFRAEKSFKVKARVRSVTNYLPKPIFD